MLQHLWRCLFVVLFVWFTYSALYCCEMLDDSWAIIQTMQLESIKVCYHSFFLLLFTLQAILYDRAF